MVVFGIIFGLIFAACLAFAVTMWIVRKSNDLGDSKGTFAEFSSTPLRMLSKSDGVNPKKWDRT